MKDYFEIDFLDVKSTRSGDAVAMRYKLGDVITIHIVDGGFQKTGDSVVQHIRDHYDKPTYIDHVVVTHPDGDHAGGLRSVLEEFEVGTLWILRPWVYADELIDRFARFTNVDNLRVRLREVYPNIDALESIALDRGIKMEEPFQGASIGAFTALSPTKEHFLDMVVESEKTPEISKLAKGDAQRGGSLVGLFNKFTNYLRAKWNEEKFSTEETSPENEMSVVQYAELCEKKILLTGDAGRSGMNHAADYLIAAGVSLPGIDRFQVPHHGSRRNVDTALLDRWLGTPLDSQPGAGEEQFTALISAAKEDEHHPRRAVVRACIHRGAKVVSTEGRSICSYLNSPAREGWTAVTPMAYPEDQED